MFHHEPFAIQSTHSRPSACMPSDLLYHAHLHAGNQGFKRIDSALHQLKGGKSISVTTNAYPQLYITNRVTLLGFHSRTDNIRTEAIAEILITRCLSPEQRFKSDSDGRFQSLLNS
ncbi:hypothetical protein O6H91_Y293300 [Diphasiastrum complanatum]|nr:hypothetical protein O6H91_Y293300 [Diphasiastrum complanatum]